MYDFGSRLKNIRLKRGLTQKDLATRINKSISAISSYESNAQLPPLDVITDIAVTLNVSVDYLVGTDEFKTISVRSFTSEESELLDLLIYEFQNKTTYSGKLTVEQIILLQKIVQYFIYK